MTGHTLRFIGSDGGLKRGKKTTSPQLTQICIPYRSNICHNFSNLPCHVKIMQVDHTHMLPLSENRMHI